MININTLCFFTNTSKFNIFVWQSENAACAIWSLSQNFERAVCATDGGFTLCGRIVFICFRYHDSQITPLCAMYDGLIAVYRLGMLNITGYTEE